MISDNHVRHSSICKAVAKTTGYEYEEVLVVVDAFLKHLSFSLKRHVPLLSFYFSFMPDLEKRDEWPEITRIAYPKILRRKKLVKKKIKIYKTKKACQHSQMKSLAMKPTELQTD